MKQKLIRATELAEFVYCSKAWQVPYGLVIYAGQQVRRVEFTDSNRKWLMHTIAAVQAARLRKQANRNHNQRGRCSGCGVLDKCDQALR